MSLPRDLTDLGWKLISRDGRLFAVSVRYGSTVPSETIEEVIRNARAMTQYIRWQMSRSIEQETT